MEQGSAQGCSTSSNGILREYFFKRPKTVSTCSGKSDLELPDSDFAFGINSSSSGINPESKSASTRETRLAPGSVSELAPKSESVLELISEVSETNPVSESP